MEVYVVEEDYGMEMTQMTLQDLDQLISACSGTGLRFLKTMVRSHHGNRGERVFKMIVSLSFN